MTTNQTTLPQIKIKPTHFYRRKDGNNEDYAYACPDKEEASPPISYIILKSN